MSSIALKLFKFLRVSSSPTTAIYFPVTGLRRSFRSLHSVGSLNGDNDGRGGKGTDEEFDDFLGEKSDLRLQTVDPGRGWGYRGVHRAIICGKVGQAPVQKILRSGRIVTILTVGAGGMFDRRIVRAKDLPKPSQWHRIAVYNETLGAYAVQQLAKNSSVYVEGDIETRVYNDSISGEVKNIPGISIRHDGKIRLVTSGEKVTDISFDDLHEADCSCKIKPEGGRHIVDDNNEIPQFFGTIDFDSSSECYYSLCNYLAGHSFNRKYVKLNKKSSSPDGIGEPAESDHKGSINRLSQLFVNKATISRRKTAKKDF